MGESSIKKVLIAVVSILAVTSLFFIFNGQGNKITNYPASGQTIVAFGDSLVEGVGATSGNDFVSILSKEIGKPIINMGVSGNTTRDGLARVEEVNEKDPKVVMVLLGGNDFLRKIPIEETFKNLDQIVESLQKEGAVVVVIGVRGGILSDQFGERFKEVAKNRGALYVQDVLSPLITHRELMSDSIHPNDLGYKKIAEKVLPVLQEAL